MPNVKSSLYGELEVNEDSLIAFPLGLPGFEEYKKFALVAFPDATWLFVLQAVDNEHICFNVADPEIFFPDYAPDLAPTDLELLETSGDDELYAYVMLTIPKDFQQTTANLLSPIIINPRLKRAVQIVPARSKYTTRHLIFGSVNAPAKKAVGAGE
ncbi:MAG: flagellar assembly protein FliW [Methylocystaceae bacterium]